MSGRSAHLLAMSGRKAGKNTSALKQMRYYFAAKHPGTINTN